MYSERERERERIKKSRLNLPVTGKQLLAVGIGGLFVLSSGAWADNSGGILSDDGNIYYGSTDETSIATTGANVTVDNENGSYDYVYGGFAELSDASGLVNIDVDNNQVTIKNGAVTESANGGYAHIKIVSTDTEDTITAQANSNSITLEGGTFSKHIYGGYASAEASGEHNLTAEASSNTVTFTDENSVKFTGDSGKNVGVLGGCADVSGTGTGTASANDNEVTFSSKNGSIESVLGGSATSSINEGQATVDGSNNTVIIKDGTVKNVFGSKTNAWIKTGNGNATATSSDNKVIVNGGTITGNLFGGSAQAQVEGEGTATIYATNNSVIVTDGTIMNIYAGNVASSYVGTGEAIAYATYNTVTIDGGTIQNDVYGGKVDMSAGSWDAFTGNTLNISSNSIGRTAYNFNTVNFTKGETYTFNISLYDAGIDEAETTLNTGDNDVVLKGNIANYSYADHGGSTLSIAKTGSGKLTLEGTNTYTGSTTVYEGTLALVNNATFDSTELIIYSKATFNAASNEIAWSDLTVHAEDRGKATYVGNLSVSGGELNFYGDLGDSGYTLLEVTGGVSLSKATYNVSMTGYGSYDLAPGTTYKLILAGDGETVSISELDEGTVEVGIGSTIAYDYKIYDDEEGLKLVIGGGYAKEESKVLLEGALAGLALLNQAADMIAMADMRYLVRSSKDEGWTPFAMVKGSSLRYDTGSHIDLDSIQLLAGLARGIDFESSHLTLGVFGEYGSGSYDTHNSFRGLNFDGSGHANYAGGGLLARYDIEASDTVNPYVDASVRMGKLYNDYDNYHLTYGSTAAGFDFSTAYYGFHAGLGVIMDMGGSTLDFSAKYLYTKIDDEETTLTTGERFKMDDLESERLRLGTILTYTINENVDILAGLHFEREFDGKARGSVNGYDMLTPSLSGNSGIGQLGVSVTPVAGLPLYIDFVVSGYTGVREGVAGTGVIQYTF